MCVCVYERERHLLLSVTYQKDSITHHELINIKTIEYVGRLKKLQEQHWKISEEHREGAKSSQVS